MPAATFWAEVRGRFATFLRSGASRYVTAALVAGLAYAVLYAMHQRYLSELGLSSPDVGLDRERLLGGPVFGLAAAFAMFAIGILLLIGLIVGGAFVATKLGGGRRSSRHESVAILVMFASLGAFLGLVALDAPTALLLAAYAGIIASVGGMMGASSRLAMSSRRGAWMVFGAVLVAIAGGGSLAFALGYAIAEDDAQLVKDGRPAAGRELLGLTLIASDARRVRFAPGPLDALDRDTRGHLECLLYLGRNDGNEVFWDVRRQHSLRAQLPDGAFEVIGSEQPVPPHCAPEPDPRVGDALLSGRPVAAVRTSGSAIGWQERLSGRWSIAIARQELVVRLQPSWAARPRWDLGPGRLPGTLAAIAARCGADRCTLRWWRATAHRALRLRFAAGPGCALEAVAATATTSVVAWSGERCRQRGLWRHARGAWRRLVSVRTRERIVSLDVDRDRVAWIASHEGEWSVATRPLRSSGVRRLAVHHGALYDGDLRASSVALAGDRVRWAASRAYDPAYRLTTFVESRQGRCSVMAVDVPGRPDGSGLDAAIVNRHVLYAHGRMLGWRRLDSAREDTDCRIAFTIAR